MHRHPAEHRLPSVGDPCPGEMGFFGTLTGPVARTRPVARILHGVMSGMRGRFPAFARWAEAAAGLCPGCGSKPPPGPGFSSCAASSGRGSAPSGCWRSGPRPATVRASRRTIGRLRRRPDRGPITRGLAAPPLPAHGCHPAALRSGTFDVILCNGFRSPARHRHRRGAPVSQAWRCGDGDADAGSVDDGRGHLRQLTARDQRLAPFLRRGYPRRLRQAGLAPLR